MSKELMTAGARGGAARAERLSPERRKEIASIAGSKRWAFDRPKMTVVSVRLEQGLADEFTSWCERQGIGRAEGVSRAMRQVLGGGVKTVAEVRASVSAPRPAPKAAAPKVAPKAKGGDIMGYDAGGAPIYRERKPMLKPVKAKK